MVTELDQAGMPLDQGFEPLSTVGALPPVFHDVFPFRYFNSIQADCFQCLYHSRDSAVVRTAALAKQTTEHASVPPHFAR
jgi:hypothetical protein